MAMLNNQSNQRVYLYIIIYNTYPYTCDDVKCPPNGWEAGCFWLRVYCIIGVVWLRD